MTRRLAARASVGAAALALLVGCGALTGLLAALQRFAGLFRLPVEAPDQHEHRHDEHEREECADDGSEVSDAAEAVEVGEDAHRGHPAFTVTCR